MGYVRVPTTPPSKNKVLYLLNCAIICAFIGLFSIIKWSHTEEGWIAGLACLILSPILLIWALLNYSEVKYDVEEINIAGGAWGAFIFALLGLIIIYYGWDQTINTILVAFNPFILLNPFPILFFFLVSDIKMPVLIMGVGVMFLLTGLIILLINALTATIKRKYFVWIFFVTSNFGILLLYFGWDILNISIEILTSLLGINMFPALLSGSTGSSELLLQSFIMIAIPLNSLNLTQGITFSIIGTIIMFIGAIITTKYGKE